MNLMNTRAFYYACASLALALTIGLSTNPAPAQAPAKPSPVIAAPVMDDAAEVKKKPPVTQKEEPAHTQTSDYHQPVCIIAGTVTAIQTIERSPWNDGTPTTLTTTEIRVSVALDSRTVQRNVANTAQCDMPADQKPVTYKLCSPTLVKQGDRIKGVEGLATGSDLLLGCLFDVAIDKAPTPAPPSPQQ